ncbi:MAG: YaaL family protein [Muribaculaceae bacterium]|nr:YaaL family protein [Roseburia sp.]MCM1430913.1 YaaL family protein [Muribaculaceae bacterium]MCM1491726.1 YaaL family protein [Muribaculaceae bacterium]
MKFFKTVPEPPDGYTVLLNDIARTTADLRNAYENLENVVEPDLIDYYIYQAKAVQMRYKFLLECAKKLEGSYTKNPL